MTSVAFERQIHQIIHLLEGSGAKVTWDDHISDPDNPSRLRQIDVTIRRGGKMTICECRLSRSRQNVKWIEELIGRCQSLSADAVIAVSSSGFTAGALKKGPRHGVILRDLRELTDTDVVAWGRQVTVTLYFYQYSGLKLTLCFAPDSIPKIDQDFLQTELRSHPAMQSVFNAAAAHIDTAAILPNERFGQEVRFGVRLSLEAFRLCGETVNAVQLEGSVRLIAQPLTSQAVLAYGRPECAPNQREITVERFSLGETAVVHHADRMSILLDVSHLEMPPLCQFRFFRTSHEDEREYEVLALDGIEKHLIPSGRMTVLIAAALP
jgi:hypothetical protein